MNLQSNNAGGKILVAVCVWLCLACCSRKAVDLPPAFSVQLPESFERLINYGPLISGGGGNAVLNSEKIAESGVTVFRIDRLTLYSEKKVLLGDLVVTSSYFPSQGRLFMSVAGCESEAVVIPSACDYRHQKIGSNPSIFVIEHLSHNHEKGTDKPTSPE